MTHITAPPSRLLAFMLHVFQCMTAKHCPVTDGTTVPHRTFYSLSQTQLFCMYTVMWLQRYESCISQLIIKYFTDVYMLTHISVMANTKMKHTTISINRERVYIIDSHTEGNFHWILMKISGTNLGSSIWFYFKKCFGYIIV